MCIHVPTGATGQKVQLLEKNPFTLCLRRLPDLIDASALDILIVNGLLFLCLNSVSSVFFFFFCKMQCFDYENFIEVNSRRPSWRCPLCNQSICHPDIRIDQNIAKASSFGCAFIQKYHHLSEPLVSCSDLGRGCRDCR